MIEALPRNDGFEEAIAGVKAMQSSEDVDQHFVEALASCASIVTLVAMLPADEVDKMEVAQSLYEIAKLIEALHVRGSQLRLS